MALQVHMLTIEVGARDKVKRGNVILGGLMLPIWSPRQVLEYMSQAQMHVAIGDMQQRLRK